MSMAISVEALVAIIGLLITLPPSIFILWKVLWNRNRRAASLGKMNPSTTINYGPLV